MRASSRSAGPGPSGWGRRRLRASSSERHPDLLDAINRIAFSRRVAALRRNLRYHACLELANGNRRAQVTNTCGHALRLILIILNRRHSTVDDGAIAAKGFIDPIAELALLRGREIAKIDIGIH